MEVKLLSLDEYLMLGLPESNVFGSPDFLRLYVRRADRVIAAVSADNRIGVVFGEREGLLRSPWSAPYCSVDTAAGVSAREVRDFGDSVRDKLSGSSVRIVTPPAVYASPELDFLAGFRRAGDTEVADTSFHIPLAGAVDESTWDRNARRNLRRGREAGLQLVRVDNYAECYDLIASHHGARGYNMAMTSGMVRETSKVVPVDFWVVQKDGVDVAAAFCYTVRPDIVQVINSGDNDLGRPVGAMTFMARALIDHYRKELVEDKGQPAAILDYGPTSVDGVQNEGLVRFKRGIGCIQTIKTTLQLHS